VKNEVLHRVNKETNKIKRRKAKWVGYMLRANSFLKQVIDRKIEENIYFEQGCEKKVNSYWTTFKEKDDN
jgi:hypothetical protein